MSDRFLPEFRADHHRPDDRDGRVGIDYGVYGVPETFVIDGDGVIRYKQIGPVTAESLRDKIIPLVQKLKDSRSESIGPKGFDATR